ncbi:nicotinamide N-methyltransferase-like [Eleutherodactylus coqui]|uniref:nicotinamide N-methyltransferase-like n=1 Tax=Eleutherodactylus coqui TaxID=57060 RepID=UPI00346216EB
MDSSCKKNYCTHEVDAKKLFETYFSDHAPYSVIKESTINMLGAFYKAFSTGMVTGRTAIDFSAGHSFHHLFAMCDFVQEITVLKLNDGSLKELEKWKNKDPDAFDWAHTKDILQELKGHRFSSVPHTFIYISKHMATPTKQLNPQKGNFAYNRGDPPNSDGPKLEPVGWLTLDDTQQFIGGRSQPGNPSDQLFTGPLFQCADLEADSSIHSVVVLECDELEDEEENLKGKIGRILKWDPSKCDPADMLSLSKADIVINYVILELMSEDHGDYRRNLKKICNVIKPGGYFLSYSAINCSYFKVGEDKYHFLPCDESFYRKVISEEGFEIKHFVKFDRLMCTDAMDHEDGIFIIANKVKEP